MPMEHLPKRKYHLWSNLEQDATAVSRPHSQSARLNRPASQQQKEKRDVALTTIQRVNLDDPYVSMLMYAYGLPLNIALDGMCTLGGMEPVKCKTQRVSSEAVDILLERNSLTSWFKPRAKLPEGTNVRLRLKDIGAFSGAIISQDKAGYRVSVDQAYRRELGAQLVDMAVKQGFGSTAPIGGIARIEPIHKRCNFIDHTNTLRQGSIVSLSRTDVILRAAIMPPMHAIISFQGPRGLKAQVIERYEIGFIAKFLREIPAELFSVKYRLSNL